MPLASFRDPDGCVVAVSDRIVRLLRPEAAARLRSFLQSEVAQAWTARRALPQTRMLNTGDPLATEALEAAVAFSPAELGAAFEHEPIWFPSYPTEWPAPALHDAASLTLDLFEALLPAGLGLKDGTPWNVQFDGCAPQFVDLASIEPRDPHDPVWLAYGQFVRTFVLPLALDRSGKLPAHESFLADREGVSVARAARLLSWSERWTTPFRGAVTLPRLLERRSARPASVPRVDPERARLTVQFLLRQLRGWLGEMTDPQRSVWTDYTTSTHSAQYHQQKIELVTRLVAREKVDTMLDVGANTGAVALAACAAGARTVAIDADPGAVSRAYQAGRGSRRFTPLVVNFAAPTPAMGWRNAETRAFLERAEKRFELVSLLAVLHHLQVTERLPLEAILRQTTRLTRKWALIEFVPPQDPLFRRLSGLNAHLYDQLTADRFERACTQFFRLVQKTPVGASGRIAYLLCLK